jgi:GNAT superfamily N-acetyltransferase
MVEIVPYAERHREGVIALILPIQQAEFDIPVTLEAQPDLLDVSAFYRKGNGNFWVALSGAELVVGTIGLLDIGNGEGALRKMFVAAPFRGAAQGVARRLLITLLHWCGMHGFGSVYLGTTDKFVAAHRFYAKNGFSVIPRGELPPAFPVMTVDTRFYRLALPSGERPAQGGAREQAR